MVASHNSTKNFLSKLIESAAVTSYEHVNYIDFIIRGYGLLVHILYFAYLLFKKDSELRMRSFLILHNVNITTFLVSLVCAVYIPYSAPTLSVELANTVMCRLTEIFWMWIKYARVLALVLLAVYRYIACKKVRLYQQINSNLLNLLVLVFLVWVVSLLIPSIIKFSLSTTYSIYFCVDGFSTNHFNISIIYYIVNTTLSSIIPTIVVFVIYKQVYSKLKEQAAKTGSNRDSSRKVRSFAKQFVVLNVITSISTVFSMFIDFINVIAVCFLVFLLKSNISIKDNFILINS